MASEPATGISTRLHAALSYRIEAHSQPLREHDKRNHGQPGKRSNQQREQKKDLLLALVKTRAPTRPNTCEPCPFRLVLSGGCRWHKNSLRVPYSLITNH
jgi:hypothetical protein